MLSPVVCRAQAGPLLAAFMRDAADSTLTSTAIMEKYFCAELRQHPGPKGEQGRKLAVGWLDLQRQHLRRLRLPQAELTFLAYDQLPGPQIPPCPFHMLGPTRHVYVARHGTSIVGYFLLNGDKLASTLLLGQGDEHYFIDFCH